MSGTNQKTPFARSMNLFAEKKIADALQKTGQSLPAHVVEVNGAIVTVAFDVENTPYTLPQVTIPLFGPEYIRYPIQVDDKGVVFAADASLRGNSGLGTGTADLSEPANLSALVFFPIANKAWSEVDPQAVTIYGPNGVVLRDTGDAANITLTPDSITFTIGSSRIVMTADRIDITSPNVAEHGVIELDGPITQTDTEGLGTTATLLGPLHVTNDVTAEGTSLHTHVHGGVYTGSSNTTPPV